MTRPPVGDPAGAPRVGAPRRSVSCDPPGPTGEDRFLARLLGALPAPAAAERSPGGSETAPRVLLGPGDDAAVVRWPDGRLLVLTTDAAEEGIHFDLRTHPLPAVGRRAVATAVSDLAAMGAAPVGTLVSLVASPRGEDAAAEAAAAAGERAAELGAPVLGGNITAGARLALHVTAVGAMASGVRPLPRTGARPGDALFATGELGGAALGLAALRRRADASGAHPAEHSVENPTENSAAEAPFVRRHLDPEPRLAAGALLAASGAVTAAMDISDGLALDLHRLAAASGVGAILEIARLPLAQAGSAGLEAALFGGEDYELLFTGAEAGIPPAIGAARLPLTRIGRITGAASGVRLRRPDGRVEALPARGWDAWTR